MVGIGRVKLPRPMPAVAMAGLLIVFVCFGARGENPGQRKADAPPAVVENRSAWANSMWPSVYLIDKRGRVRYWWYGEMNWQKMEGEDFIRNKIEQLLAEN